MGSALQRRSMSTSRDPCVEAEGLSASYGEGALRYPVLVDASFEVPHGKVTVITGPSGSGKTTLLSLIGGLDRPEAGRLVVAGQELTAMGRKALAGFRRERVGFVFQSFNLLPTLTARENVEAGLEPLGISRGEARRRASTSLGAVGLAEKQARFPHELSGGEQQRVAVARACAKEPPLLLADEPTGNLDEEAGARVLDLIVGETRGAHTPTVLIVTHDPSVAARADLVLTLRNHQIV